MTRPDVERQKLVTTRSAADERALASNRVILAKLLERTKVDYDKRAAAKQPPPVIDVLIVSGGGDWGGSGGDWSQGGNQSQQFTRGRVTASSLLLRSEPNRGSQVIRVVHQGDIVRIFCKTEGESVQGNRFWYLLADGTWAWGSARFIETRHTPRWC